MEQTTNLPVITSSPLPNRGEAGSSHHITFSGVCLQGKAKGTRIIGFGYYRKGDKHYVHGSDIIPGDIFDHDGWHLIDPETLSVVVAKY